MINPLPPFNINNNEFSNLVQQIVKSQKPVERLDETFLRLKHTIDFNQCMNLIRQAMQINDQEIWQTLGQHLGQKNQWLYAGQRDGSGQVLMGQDYYEYSQSLFKLALNEGSNDFFKAMLATKALCIIDSGSKKSEFEKNNQQLFNHLKQALQGQPVDWPPMNERQQNQYIEHLAILALNAKNQEQIKAIYKQLVAFEEHTNALTTANANTNNDSGQGGAHQKKPLAQQFVQSMLSRADKEQQYNDAPYALIEQWLFEPINLIDQINITAPIYGFICNQLSTRKENSKRFDKRQPLVDSLIKKTMKAIADKRTELAIPLIDGINLNEAYPVDARYKTQASFLDLNTMLLINSLVNDDIDALIYMFEHFPLPQQLIEPNVLMQLQETKPKSMPESKQTGKQSKEVNQEKQSPNQMLLTGSWQEVLNQSGPVFIAKCLFEQWSKPNGLNAQPSNAPEKTKMRKTLALNEAMNGEASNNPLNPKQASTEEVMDVAWVEKQKELTKYLIDQIHRQQAAQRHAKLFNKALPKSALQQVCEKIEQSGQSAQSFIKEQAFAVEKSTWAALASTQMQMILKNNLYANLAHLNERYEHNITKKLGPQLAQLFGLNEPMQWLKSNPNIEPYALEDLFKKIDLQPENKQYEQLIDHWVAYGNNLLLKGQIKLKEKQKQAFNYAWIQQLLGVQLSAQALPWVLSVKDIDILGTNWLAKIDKKIKAPNQKLFNDQSPEGLFVKQLINDVEPVDLVKSGIVKFSKDYQINFNRLIQSIEMNTRAGIGLCATKRQLDEKRSEHQGNTNADQTKLNSKKMDEAILDYWVDSLYELAKKINEANPIGAFEHISQGFAQWVDQQQRGGLINSPLNQEPLGNPILEYTNTKFYEIAPFLKHISQGIQINEKLLNEPENQSALLNALSLCSPEQCQWLQKTYGIDPMQLIDSKQNNVLHYRLKTVEHGNENGYQMQNMHKDQPDHFAYLYGLMDNKNQEGICVIDKIKHIFDDATLAKMQAYFLSQRAKHLPSNQAKKTKHSL